MKTKELFTLLAATYVAQQQYITTQRFVSMATLSVFTPFLAATYVPQQCKEKAFFCLAFPWQQWVPAYTAMLHCTHIASLVPDSLKAVFSKLFCSRTPFGFEKQTRILTSLLT
jgi:hypothetical protein